VALYRPFLMRLEANRKNRQVNALASAIQSLSNKESAQQRVLMRPDSIGDFARALSTDFAKALRTNQVFQVYQPKHDAQGRISGVEALMRWTHPIYGPIAPSAFISVAEESRLINSVGTWSLERALAAQSRWQKAGLPLIKMSVNLSPVELDDPGYVPRLRALLQHHHIAPHMLELEVTEGVEISSSAEVRNTLDQLAEMGVQLSIDDFGMGYTSLMYLQRLQVSAIKIDGALTREIVDSPVLTDIVKTVCDLGHQRSVRVVAEFVETHAQQALLAQLGCNEFQGYLYSRPITEDAFLIYMQRRM
jgi:EAL domain-containing protein (putative c-di-GMP-specific phosphodiesterase class I)